MLIHSTDWPLICRQRSKRKDQRANGQPHAGGGVGAGEGRTYYAGIHYASASVVSRENEVRRVGAEWVDMIVWETGD